MWFKKEATQSTGFAQLLKQEKALKSSELYKNDPVYKKRVKSQKQIQREQEEEIREAKKALKEFFLSLCLLIKEEVIDDFEIFMRTVVTIVCIYLIYRYIPWGEL